MNIVWQYADQILRPALSLVQNAQQYDWSLRDVVELNLQLAEFATDGESLVAREAPAGWAPRFELKMSDDRASAALAWAYDWTLSGSGTNAKYTALLDLNVAGLIDAVEDESVTLTYLDLVGEFTLQDVTGRNRDSTRIACRITRDIIRPGTPAPTILQSSPWVTEVVANGGRHLVFKNSDGQVLQVMSPPGVPYP